MGGKLLYNVVLVSAIQQHESAITIYISPPPWASTTPSSHSSRSSRSTGLGSPCYITTGQPPILHMIVNICWCFFLHRLTLSFPQGECQSVLYICISIPSLWIPTALVICSDQQWKCANSKPCSPRGVHDSSSFFETCCRHTNKPGLACWIKTAQSWVTLLL